MKSEDNIYLGTVTVRGYITKYGGEYVIYSDGDGGVIVSSKDKEEAEKKFNEGTRLAFAVRNLNFYRDAVMADDEGKEKFAKDLKTPTLKIEFVEP